MQKKILHGLYGISDTTLTPKTTLFTQLEYAIEGGLKIFQYRDKISKDSEIKSFIKELQDFCTQKNVLFVLNDRHNLALELELCGLHLGKEELDSFQSIRKEFKGIIGVSCYNSISMAKEFMQKGADYVAFGAFFQSQIKPDTTRCHHLILQEAKQELNIPICAIGGINTNNIHLVQESDMIAIISSLWLCDNKDISHYENKELYLKQVRDNAKKLCQNAGFMDT